MPLTYAHAFPLFGAWEEQKWDSEWKPRFIYPDPPRDQEGAVFTIETPQHSSVWVNTAFDRANGRVQYVNVRSGRLVTRIDIRIESATPVATEVFVVYERTALDESGAAEIRALAISDPQQGPHWQSAIDAYAATSFDSHS